MTSRKRGTNRDRRSLSVLRLELLSVLRGSETGVEGAITWVSAGEFDPSTAHLGPRLLLVLGDEISSDKLTSAVTVRLTCPPEVHGVLPSRIAREVESFTTTNRETLLQHWTGEIDTRETLDLLKKVPR